jgi:hypothetical protein
MFITTGGYTINTDHIIHAKDLGDGTTVLYMTSGEELTIDNPEADAMWRELNTQKSDGQWKSA